ncbi:unnamed protein product [Brachionus calyciflorus]|uniref:peptidylprolyl isomerase n=1 Tax=Brachionus calyciflorus TaxID=104777 RepID=A0A813XRJ1_9BILA|nr:unnamed protein product [Brachionus calyciflorus]
MSNPDQMVMGIEAFDCGIQKRLVYAGKTPIEYVDGTKVYFHFKTIVSETGKVLDDSKKINEKKPMELIIGKKFKIETWEKCIRTMWLNEVAKFTVVKELLYEFPIAAKQLRDYYAKICDHKTHNHSKTDNHRHHCCGFNIMEHGVGYEDLDELLKNPKNLDFIFEIIKVEQPGDYKKDAWSLTEEERIKQIPILKENGNALFKEKKYEEACKQYEEALGYLEQLMFKEKPNDIEWNEWNDVKIPILLNYCLCKFNLKEYYTCIEHTNTILESQPNNTKALYRRAKSYASVWNLEEARKDFIRCAELDPSLKNDVTNQLNQLDKIEALHNKKESERFRGKLFA